MLKITNDIYKGKLYYKLNYIQTGRDDIKEYTKNEEYGYFNINELRNVVISKYENYTYRLEDKKKVSERKTNVDSYIPKSNDNYFYLSIENKYDGKNEDILFKNGKHKTTSEEDYNQVRNYYQTAFASNGIPYLHTDLISEETIRGEMFDKVVTKYKDNKYLTISFKATSTIIDPYRNFSSKQTDEIIIVFKDNKLFEYGYNYTYAEKNNTDEFTVYQRKSAFLKVIDKLPKFNTNNFVEFNNKEEILENK